MNRNLARQRPRASLFEGALWMVGLTFVLFFLPLLNGFIGGVVGGYRVRGVRRALTAALLPTLFVSALLFGLFTLVGAPVVGLFAGIGAGVLVALVDVGIFLGAAIGGAFGKLEGPVEPRRLEA